MRGPSPSPGFFPHSHGECSPRSFTLVRYRWTLSSTSSFCEWHTHISTTVVQSKNVFTDHTVVSHCRLVTSTTTTTACVIAACSKSPHSQTGKRTTFGSSSSPLSCSWYARTHTPHLPYQTIDPLSSLTTSISTSGPVPALQPPLPLLPARLRADLLLVPPAPDDAHIALRPAHHHGPVPPLCPRRILLGAHRHMARGGERPRRVRGRPRGMVHTRRVGSRDGRWTDDI